MSELAFHHANELKPGYQLEQFEIQYLLGSGKTGFTYKARNKSLDCDVAIKEYFPTAIALRRNDSSIGARNPQLRSQYESDLVSFLTKANSVSNILHPGIVHVQTVFEKNGTAYMVMDYVEGESLADLLSIVSGLPQSWQKRALIPIFSGLTQIHELGLIHGNINPSSIKIKQNGSAVLINFANGIDNFRSNSQPMKIKLSDSYAPYEQFSTNREHLGPWTDIYSLAATMYHGITGFAPESSISRSERKLRRENDCVMAQARGGQTHYDKEYLDAIERGLSLDPELRPRSVDTWLALFNKGTSNEQDEQVSGLPPTVTKRVTSSKVKSTNPNIEDDSINPVNLTMTGTSAKWALKPDRNEVSYVQETTETIERSSGPAKEAREGNRYSRIFPVAIFGVLAIVFLVQSKFFNTHDSGSTEEAMNSGALSSATNRSNEKVTPPTVLVASVAANSTTDKTEDLQLIDRISVSQPSEPDYVSRPATNSQDQLLSFGTGSDVLAQNDRASIDAEIDRRELQAPAIYDADITTQAQAEIYFDTPLADDTDSATPRSISELIKSEPAYPPIEGLDSSVWKGKDCSGCHSWTRDDICAQGQFYFKNDEARVSRLKHPHGGFFKRAIKQWAAGQCQ